MDFLHVSNTRDILKRLDDAEQSRRILPIFGSEATGKTRLVSYWMNEYPAKERNISHELRPALYVDLWEPQRRTIGRTIYVTPITNVLFGEILYQMARIPSSYQRKIQESRWYQPTGVLSTDQQFITLFNFVRSFFKHLHIRMLIIDNAQFLDTCALDKLMRLRKERTDTCGIGLCIRLEKNEKFIDALEQFRKRLPDENRRELARPDPVELQRMEPKEFRDVVLKEGIFQKLNIMFPTNPSQEEVAEQKRIVKQAWNLAAQGDWYSIENLYERFRLALGEHNGRPHMLTPEILREVFGS